MIKKTFTKNVCEQTNLNDYSHEDFVDVFLILFKEWIIEKIGDGYKKYPVSLLLKKYGKEFLKEKGIATEYEPKSFYSMSNYGRELVKRGFYSLPELYSEEKFTEKYKKILPYAISYMDLPDFIQISFIEASPNQVIVDFNYDFDEWMRYPNDFNMNGTKLLDKLKDFFRNYAGVEFGNPLYGEVSMDYTMPKKTDVDTWVKKTLNKVIKNKIKEGTQYKGIQSIRFSSSYYGAYLNVIFTRGILSFQEKIELVNEINRIVRSLGYGPNLEIGGVYY